MRNHNPLNIRRSEKTHWLGQEARQTDREFVQFRCDLMGYRAAFRILHTYVELYKLNTLRGIIGRWAPPEDGNLTSQYVNMVSNFSGISPGAVIAYEDEPTMLALVSAMARVESGATADSELLRKAYELAK